MNNQYFAPFKDHKTPPFKNCNILKFIGINNVGCCM